MAREIKVNQDYKNKMLKLIPSEIIAAYMVVEGVIPDEHQKVGSIIVSVGLLILIPFYLNRFYQIRRFGQHLFIMIAFIIWVYTLGGPFRAWGVHEAYIGSILLVFYTLLIPLFYHPREAETW